MLRHLPIPALLFAALAVLLSAMLFPTALFPAELFAAEPSTAQQPPKELVAVLDLRGVGASEAETVAITSRLREVLLNTGRVTLVDRSQMQAILDEQALQQTGCTSQQCAVQVGQILGVRNIVSGEVVKVSDGIWMVATLMIDVETSETMRVASVRHRGDYFSLLDNRIPEMADKLIAGAAPPPSAGTQPPAVKAAPAAVAPSAPPGEGQGTLRVEVGSLVEFRFSTDPAGARVYLDGKRLRSVTPYETIGFYAGDHQVLIKKPGYRAVSRAVIGTPGIVEIAERLEPIRGSAIDLSDAPAELAVSVDGQPAGTTPLAIDGLAAGSHRVELRGEGYKTWAEEVALKPGEDHVVVPGLQRIRIALFPGQMALNPWARQYAMVMDALKDGVVSAAFTRLTFTAYPELAGRSGAQPFSEKADVHEQTWTGFFFKEPDPAFIQRKGRELSVDGVLLFDLKVTGDESGSITIYLYDVASGKVEKRTQSWGRHTAKPNISLSIASVLNAFSQGFQ